MTHTTLETLKLKAQSKKVRMPSINKISEMLTEFGIEHTVDGVTAVTSRKSAGCRYVNSRTETSGKILTIPEAKIKVDTTYTNYSTNNWYDASCIIKLLATKGIA